MSSRFLALPAEIRNLIYLYTILESEPLLIASACKHANSPSASQPPLTRVNRQIRSETLSMFYTQNQFSAHIHRCDFGHLIAFMDDIGTANRSRIRNVKLHLKDRWTCGVGLLDFFRWCTRSEGTDDMNVDYSARDWNMEHIDWMPEEDRKEMAHEPDDYDKYMGQTLCAMDEVLSLAKEMSIAKKTSERQIRQAWQERLAEMSFDCSDCFAEAWNGIRGAGDDYRGYCTSRFGFADAKAALAIGCQHY